MLRVRVGLFARAHRARPIPGIAGVVRPTQFQSTRHVVKEANKTIANDSRNEIASGVARQIKWKDVKLWPQKELKFTQYPKQPGTYTTIACMFGANFAVFLAWQYAAYQSYEEREKYDGETQTYIDRAPAQAFMEKYFLGRNDWLEQGYFWLPITTSFSHQSWSHFSGNMLMFVYLGRRLHDFLGRARFIQLYLAGAIGGEIVTTLYPKYRPEWVEQVNHTCMSSNGYAI